MSESLRHVKITGLTVVALVLLHGGVSAQDFSPTPMPTIRVAAEASVATAPDQAQVSIGVVTEAENAQDAAAENAQELASVLAKLRDALGGAAEIKSVGYSLNPKYHRSKEGGEPRIVGYMATNTVEVTTSELDQVGNIIGVAAATGANRIQQLRFTLKDEAPLQAEALRRAAVLARNKAEAIASALDLKTGRIVAVEEATHAITPILMRSRQVALADAGVGSAPPVEPGTIEVRATVTLAVEIAQ